mmetsp:Transcript_25321/g.51645  ORF Transcript_25321/g.51645 Transcript_25321/m.51645 type:complete len:84 (-) Transcript_25321:742-993(-)
MVLYLYLQRWQQEENELSSAECTSIRGEKNEGEVCAIIDGYRHHDLPDCGALDAATVLQLPFPSRWTNVLNTINASTILSHDA